LSVSLCVFVRRFTGRRKPLTLDELEAIRQDAYNGTIGEKMAFAGQLAKQEASTWPPGERSWCS
jgi:hypothetical protein